MLFLINLVAVLVTMLCLLQLGLIGFSQTKELQQRLNDERHEAYAVKKCAAHMANKRNIDDAFRFLMLSHPKQAQEWQKIHREISTMIQQWERQAHCSPIPSTKLAPSVQRNRNYHLHPYWPNWIPAYTLAATQQDG